jgi:putative ribosome biogenesis GTPase RsgA
MMKGGVVLPPPGSFEEVDLYTRKRWRQVQYLVELFWTRWRSQYLTTLQLRRKWQKQKRNVSVGDVVLLKEGPLRSEWRLGRVVEVIPSRDNLVRRVKLKVCSSTSDRRGLLERPVTKLVVLIEAV